MCAVKGLRGYAKYPSTGVKALTELLKVLKPNFNTKIASAAPSEGGSKVSSLGARAREDLKPFRSAAG